MKLIKFISDFKGTTAFWQEKVRVYVRTLTFKIIYNFILQNLERFEYRFVYSKKRSETIFLKTYSIKDTC